jgi:hypothetical protein
VALNWQTTTSYELRLNKGFFKDNGNCGFILKPAFLRQRSSAEAPASNPPAVRGAFRQLKVKVLSAHGLPKPDGETEGEIIDPYIYIFLEGFREDKEKYSTEHISDDGFHPVWDRGTSAAKAPSKVEFSFTIQNFELATLVIQAWDKDIDRDDFLAEAFIPLKLLRRGVRCVPLTDVWSDKLLGSFVLCEFEVS